MKLKKERPAVPYTYLIDNFKVLLIFLVVFNHIIAFNLVKSGHSGEIRVVCDHDLPYARIYFCFGVFVKETSECIKEF